MPRLPPDRWADLPGILQRNGGDIPGAAEELGVTRQAVVKRLKKGDLVIPPKRLTEVTPATMTPEDGSEDRTTARALAKRAAAHALKLEADGKTDPELLLKAARAFVDLSNASTNARRAAIVYLDQRQVHLNGNTDAFAQAVRQIETRLRGKVSDEVLLLVGEALK